MLKQLGRLERTRNIVILGFAILMAVSLIVFYAPGRSASNIDPTKNTEVVAKVGSDQHHCGRSRTHQRKLHADVWRPHQPGPAGRQQAFSRRPDQQARDFNQEAERLGLGASDEELAKRFGSSFPMRPATLSVLKDTKRRSSRATAISRSLKMTFATRSRRKNCERS